MWSSRRRRGVRRAEGVHVPDQPRLTNVVSRSHGLTVELPRELARSRRHSHQFSLIMLREDRRPGHDHRRLPTVIDRLALRLRLSDLLINLADDRLLVACPETNSAGARVLMTDIVNLVEAEGVGVRASFATFPKSALTAAELLRACEADLEHHLAPALGDQPPQLTGTDALHIISNEGGRG